jgi:hypothetical protein
MEVEKLITWLEFLTDDGICFDDRLDRWEAFVADKPQQECPLKHTYPVGMYVREIFAPAGSIITSRIHKFDHPFFLMKGKLTVISETEGLATYTAPAHGITLPQTRRAILIHEDTVWITVHPNPENKKDHEEIKNDLTYMRDNKYLPCHL